MATPTLKWPLRIGAPKSTSDNSTFSDNDGSNPNPNANNTPTFFKIKHYKWLLQYQQLFQFYLVHGHINVTRHNADNSLAEWASYQRSKMVVTDKYDVKWKHLLNGIGFCSTPPPTPNQVFDKHMLAYNVLRGTQNAITPKKADSKDLHGWWKYWRQQGKQCLMGEPSKIKDHDLQKLFDLYSADIFSGISFEMQNGLPSRMHQLSIAHGVLNTQPLLTNHGVPDSFQTSTAKDPKHYGLPKDGLSDRYPLVLGMNPSHDDTDISENSDPFNCDILPSSSDEDESASIKYLKRHPDPSLRSWDGASFYKTEKTLNNACIRAENYYRGYK
jgi:hypothetical protein